MPHNICTVIILYATLLLKAFLLKECQIICWSNYLNLIHQNKLNKCKLLISPYCPVFRQSDYLSFSNYIQGHSVRLEELGDEVGTSNQGEKEAIPTNRTKR